ncbi:hypothetical protein TNCV_2718221 [Trichonephila clavipes]|nr:hypothetical protein TNCV_2718221 [Trichonephila clavipes]
MVVHKTYHLFNASEIDARWHISEPQRSTPSSYCSFQETSEARFKSSAHEGVKRTSTSVHDESSGHGLLSNSQPSFDLLIQLGLQTQALQCRALSRAFRRIHQLSAPDFENPAALDRHHYLLMNLFTWQSTTSSIKLSISSGYGNDSV